MKTKIFGPFEVEPSFSGDIHAPQNWVPDCFLVTTPSGKFGHGGKFVAQVEPTNLEGGIEEARMVAQLFAAAPDLLVACKALIKMQCKKVVSNKEASRTWAKVLKAIGRATLYQKE